MQLTKTYRWIRLPEKGGCGFMGPTPGKIEGVLPNLGLGLRIEVQPRMNVRLDFGRDMVNKQNLFYFNMTEAF